LKKDVSFLDLTTAGSNNKGAAAAERQPVGENKRILI
jgi:hypothetical protein